MLCYLSVKNTVEEFAVSDKSTYRNICLTPFHSSWIELPCKRRLLLFKIWDS